MAVASTSTYPFHHANDTRTSFKNPWDSALPPTLFELASSPFPLSFSTANPTLLGHRHAKEVGVISPTWKARSDGGEGIDSKGKGSVIKGTWLGHAASFLELPIATEDIAKSKRSVRILFDPVFSWRVGPTPYIGPSRLSASPCTVDDLPGCDIICISHNHYDHLDAPTILALRSRFPEARYFVPLGLRTFLLDSGVSEEFISELDWWESLDISSLELGFEEGKDTLRLSCVPAQHNSGRGPRDLASTLWCGWVVESFAASSADGDNPLIRQSSVYFAGWLRLHLGSFYETNRLAVLCSDTGYRRYSTSTEVCPAFKEIGEKFGSFDLAFIPIWRGGTLSFFSWLGFRLSHESLFSAFHCSPTDAVAIHQDVRSKNSVAIHFGTFIGHQSESLEAVIELMESCEKEGICGLGKGDGEIVEVLEKEGNGEGGRWKGRMGVIDQGETIEISI